LSGATLKEGFPLDISSSQVSSAFGGQNMSEQRCVVSVVVGLLLLAAAPRAVLAQQTSASALEEIVVTARKREENLQDVPVAVSVFTGQALQQAGILSTRDLYSVTPGLNYDTGFDQNAGTPAIRGVVSTEIATYRQKVTTFLLRRSHSHTGWHSGAAAVRRERELHDTPWQNIRRALLLSLRPEIGCRRACHRLVALRFPG
jgi:hypothetical protein